MKTSSAILFILIMLTFFAGCGDNGVANKPASSTPVTASGLPASTQQPADVEVKNLASQASRLHMGKQMPELEKLYSSDCSLVKSDGKKDDKAACLAEMRSGDLTYEAYSYDQVGVQIDPDGNRAVVNARATTKGKTKGKPFATQFHEKQTWSKSADGWKITGVDVTDIVELPPADDSLSKDIDPKANDRSPANK